MSKNKVLLMAIAKDEGAYLPEWIFHHLNIGVDSISIYVNSTTDNSGDILDKINKNHNVNYTVIDGMKMDEFDHLIDDHFLKRNAFQSRAYAHAYGNCDPDEFSHILYLDIDEFLICPENNIESLLNKLQKNVTLFSWFNSTGDAKNFSSLLNCSKGDKSWYTKYLVTTGCDNLQFLSTHLASTGTQSQELALEKDISVKGEVYSGDIWTKNAYVLHRYLRANDEYLSLLGRSDLYNKTLIGLKNNRKGWRETYKIELPFNKQLKNNYQTKYNTFITKNHIQKELQLAQEFVLNRSQQVIKKINDVKNLNDQLEQILDGCNIKHHDYTILKLAKKYIKKLLKLDRPKHLV